MTFNLFIAGQIDIYTTFWLLPEELTLKAPLSEKVAVANGSIRDAIASWNAIDRKFFKAPSTEALDRAGIAPQEDVSLGRVVFEITSSRANQTIRSKFAQLELQIAFLAGRARKNLIDAKVLTRNEAKKSLPFFADKIVTFCGICSPRDFADVQKILNKELRNQHNFPCLWQLNQSGRFWHVQVPSIASQVVTMTRQIPVLAEQVADLAQQLPVVAGQVADLTHRFDAFQGNYILKIDESVD